MKLLERIRAAFRAQPEAPRTKAIAFDGASTGRRLKRWVATPGDLNSILSIEGDELRRRSRDLARKNPFAANALESFVGNCVGTGIVPQPQHPNENVRKDLQEWWARWTDEADSANLTDFYGLQSMACRGTMEAGEVFVRIRKRRSEDGLFVPLQLQIIESEHLPLEKTELAANGNVIRNGIEFDRIGRRVAYHMWRSHPGSQMVGADANVTVPVPASSVLHMYKPIRPGQIRGQVWFATVLALAYEIEQWMDAEVVRKKTAAMITHIIEELNPDDPLNVGEEDEPDEDGTLISAIEPGSTVKLVPGEKITTSQSADVAGIDFLKMALREFAVGIGVTYEQLTGDLNGVTFSSIRAGINEFQRRCEQFQHQVMAFQLNRPVWRAFIEACVEAELISARDYRANKQQYLNVLWRPPKWRYVNPVDDVKAEVMAINARLKSRSQSIKESGEDPEVVDRQIAEDESRLKKLGVSPAVSGNSFDKTPPVDEAGEQRPELVQ